MTVTARRIYYSIAILIFLVLAPVVLMTAKGYQWSGWRFGFVQTGVLVVETSEKATVSINGAIEETTTKLTKRLRPGQYEVSLDRQGYLPWKSLVTIRAQTATVVGPVILFPATLAINTQPQSWPLTLFDPVSQTVFGGEPNIVGWEVRQLWPTGSNWTIQIPNKPATIRFSPKERLLVADTEAGSFITTPGGQEAPWMIESVDRIFWSNQGDAVFYTIRGQQLLRLDSLARTATLVAERTSAGWFDGQVWSTESTAEQTLLYRQTIEASEPILVRDFVGLWMIETSPDGTLLVRNQSDHQAVAFTKNAQAEPVALGVVEEWWWPEQNTPPLWQSGAQLYTMDNDRPLLLERGPESYQSVHWISPDHILVSLEGQKLTVRSVSARQGRGTILQQQVPASSELLGVDRNRRLIILRTTEVPSTVYTLSWQ